MSSDIGLGDMDTLAWEATESRLIACDFNASDGLPPLASLDEIFGAPAWTAVGNPPSNNDVGDAAINPITGRFFVAGFDADGGFLVEVIDGYSDYQTNGAFGTDEQVVGIAFVPSPECLGDANDDGVVDVQDLLAVILEWGPCSEGCTADFDDSGAVTVEDLLTVILAWGVCP